MWKTDMEKMRRVAAELRDEVVATGVEMSFCSHCGDRLPDGGPIFESRIADPEGEWEVTDSYCAKCVVFDPTRRKPDPSPHPSDG